MSVSILAIPPKSRLDELVTESNKTKTDSAPIAVVIAASKGTKGSVSNLNYFGGQNGLKTHVWHHLIQSLGESHYLDVTEIDPYTPINPSRISCWNERKIDLYLVPGEGRMDSLLHNLDAPALDQVQRIFLLASDALKEAKKLATWTKKDIWVAHDVCSPFLSHVMSLSGAIIHFSANCSRITTVICKPGGHVEKFNGKVEEIEEDVERAVKAGNPIAQFQARGIFKFLHREKQKDVTEGKDKE